MLITVLGMSSRLSAYAIHASQWKHPDDEQKTVTFVSDVHIGSDANSSIREWDESQVRDLTQHLNTDHSCVAIVEDYCETLERRENFRTRERRENFRTRFLPGTTCILQKSDIKAYAVDFRGDCYKRIYREPWDTNKVITEAAFFMNLYERVETQLPARYQEDLKILKDDIVQLVSKFPSVFDHDDINAKEQLKGDAFFIYGQLFEFVLLAEIDNHISCNDKVYVCAGHLHIKVLEKALKQAGYTRIAKTLNLPKSACLRDVQQKCYKKIYNQEDPPPINLKKALENLDKGISEYTPMNVATTA